MLKTPFVAVTLVIILVPLVAAAEPAAGTLWREPTTQIEFVWVPSGCFEMGSSFNKPIHRVCVKGFWMGRHEVTQAQYRKITGGNPSKFKDASNPVEHVSWGEAMTFSEKMSRKAGASVALPTEAQWEYACRAGVVQHVYCGSDSGLPDAVGWYDGNSGKKPHSVGKKNPNDWGLFDMSGNVWEWTQDCWNGSYEGAPADGAAWEAGDCGRRVVRGGSWQNKAANMHATIRGSNDAGLRYGNVGFRVAITLP